jgi:hypothetical protein
VTGRLSVVVPFEPNEHGEAVHMFAFMCFSSCVGSLNRKPCHIIFSLELGGQVIGRQTIDIRVCACPGRDKRSELSPNPRKHQESTAAEGDETPPLPQGTDVLREDSRHELSDCDRSVILSYSAKRVKLEDDDDDSKIYYVPVKGRKNYNMLLKMAESLALIEHVSQFNPKYLDQFRYLLQFIMFQLILVFLLQR